MDAGIHIGANIADEGYEKLTEALVQLATVSPFEEVNLAALRAFERAAQVQNVSITGSSITGDNYELHGLDLDLDGD